MRRFSFRPALTLRGRAFKGPRGWAGKPLHPPLTDIPIGAYMLAAAFDLISTRVWRIGSAGHASFSTKPSSWRRLRHSYTPSVCMPYSLTIESPVSQYERGSGLSQ